MTAPLCPQAVQTASTAECCPVQSVQTKRSATSVACCVAANNIETKPVQALQGGVSNSDDRLTLHCRCWVAEGMMDPL